MEVGKEYWLKVNLVNDKGFQNAFRVRFENETGVWLDENMVEHLYTTPPDTRPDWEVLRAAADIWDRTRHNATISSMMREDADILEENARPKLTLAEAVRAYAATKACENIAEVHRAWRAVKEALVREESR